MRNLVGILLLVVFLPVKIAADWWTDAKCDACVAGMVSGAVVAQGFGDAFWVGESESEAVLSAGVALEVTAKAEGKSVEEAAEQSAEFQTLLSEFAKKLLLTVRNVGVPVAAISNECIVGVLMENLLVVLGSAGQVILPIVIHEVALWNCCDKKKCKPRKPIPIPPPPSPAPSEQKVVRLDDAMQAGKEAGIKASKTANLNDTDLWFQAQEAVRDLGEFCTRNGAPQVATNEEEKIEQNVQRIDFLFCACQFYCYTWQFSSRPKDWPNSENSCHDLVSLISGFDSTCPGAWWRHIPGPDMFPPIYPDPPVIYYPDDQVCTNEVPVEPTTRDMRQFLLPLVKIVFSFGARTEKYNIFGPDLDKDLGMKRIGVLKQELIMKFNPYWNPNETPQGNFVYIDKDTYLPGRYEEPKGSGIWKNKWWQQYYQAAMDNSHLMIFLIDEAWLSSENCWQELAWATNRELNSEAMKKTPPEISYETQQPREYIPNHPPWKYKADKKQVIVAYLGEKYMKEPYRTFDGEEVLLWGRGGLVGAISHLPSWTSSDNTLVKAIEVVCPELSLQNIIQDRVHKKPDVLSHLACITDKISELVQSGKLDFSNND